jgi:hypothetical protein
MCRDHLAELYHSWKDNIKTDHNEIRCENMKRIKIGSKMWLCSDSDEPSVFIKRLNLKLFLCPLLKYQATKTYLVVGAFLTSEIDAGNIVE